MYCDWLETTLMHCDWLNSFLTNGNILVFTGQFKSRKSRLAGETSKHKTRMAPNYPDLPDSPAPSSKSVKKSKQTTNANAKKHQQPSSPLSTTSEVPEIEEFDKYEVRRAATGTGIFSSLFTLSMVSTVIQLDMFIYCFFS